MDINILTIGSDQDNNRKEFIKVPKELYSDDEELLESGIC